MQPMAAASSMPAAQLAPFSPAISSLCLLSGRALRSLRRSSCGAARNERAQARACASLIHMWAGVLLMAGVLRVAATGSSASEPWPPRFPGWLIFLAFGINACAPLLSAWLQDAYPESTVRHGVPFRVHDQGRGLRVAARLCGHGDPDPSGRMIAFPIFYAVIENDLRRVLAYSLVNQLGFMVVGIGIGTELALNGAVAHAFADILFKAYSSCRWARCSRDRQAQGLRARRPLQTMPWTTGCCMVGALRSRLSRSSRVRDKIDDLGCDGPASGPGSFLFAAPPASSPCRHKDPYFVFFPHDSGQELPTHPGTCGWPWWSSRCSASASA